MQSSTFKLEKKPHVKVAHNSQRQILEMLSLFRVMNNYYHKKSEIQKQIQPLIFKKFKEGLTTIKKKGDWLFTLPTALNTLSDDFLSKRDSFRFPDSIILFEAWMNLGIAALYPKIVLNFKFPGILKGEKTRNVFLFIFATSRGFGFPIYFGPEFYKYKLNKLKYIQPFLKWSYTVCHKANQAIVLVNKKVKSKRHHPGEFESVIISEYDNKIYKGINTLLHGVFTGVPNPLGKFTSIEEALENVIFSYTIGDHAMSVEKLAFDSSLRHILETPVISHDAIVQKYDIDFYTYIRKLMNLDKLLITKISEIKKKRKDTIKNLKIIDRIRYFLENLLPDKYLSTQFTVIKKFSQTVKVLEKVREFLWTTPLFTHTIHSPTEKELKFILLSKGEIGDEFDHESTNSILLTVINRFEKMYGFKFEDVEVIESIKELRDQMAKMWLYFKERHFRYAVKKLNELSSISLDDEGYKAKINEALDKLIPIIAIYEIFNRPLAESVYPESSPQTNRLGYYLARFFSSKYNPLGVNLMKMFNNLAYYNWSYFIKHQKLNTREFFDFALKLPIWTYIPSNIKSKILNYNS